MFDNCIDVRMPFFCTPLLVSSFLILTLVASPSAAAENLDLELRKLSNTIKLLIFDSCFLFLTLVASPGIEPGSGASETLILSIVLRGHYNKLLQITKRTLTNLQLKLCPNTTVGIILSPPWRILQGHLTL